MGPPLYYIVISIQGLIIFELAGLQSTNVVHGGEVRSTMLLQQSRAKIVLTLLPTAIVVAQLWSRVFLAPNSCTVLERYNNYLLRKKEISYTVFRDGGHDIATTNYSLTMVKQRTRSRTSWKVGWSFHRLQIAMFSRNCKRTLIVILQMSSTSDSYRLNCPKDQNVISVYLLYRRSSAVKYRKLAWRIDTLLIKRWDTANIS